MLRRLRSSWHKVYTGYCVLNISRQIVYQDVAETKVFIKDLTDEEIERYMRTSEPFDKAGSYAVQGKGGYMVKEIKGSYSNVVGLPICEITEFFCPWAFFRDQFGRHPYAWVAGEDAGRLSKVTGAGEVRLVAGRKRSTLERRREAIGLGIRDFGENYVQEAKAEDRGYRAWVPRGI